MSLSACLMLLALTVGDLPDRAPIFEESRLINTEEPRYESRKSYDDTVKHYSRLFGRIGGVRWRTIINFPGIRGIHVQSLQNHTYWSGINIYEYRGKVRYFILERAPEDIKPRKK